MLIRYGGDEFLLIMPGIKEQDFKNKLLQILEEVLDHTAVGQNTADAG